jgi:hypothetical protein
MRAKNANKQASKKLNAAERLRDKLIFYYYLSSFAGKVRKMVTYEILYCLEMEKHAHPTTC